MIRISKKTAILGGVILCIISSAITFLSLFLGGLVDISAPIDLTIQISDDNEIQYQKEYDGLPYMPSKYVLTSGKMHSGDYIAYIDFNEENIDEYSSVGTYDCKKLFRVYNSDKEDVTKQYNITVNVDKVGIVKRKVSIDYSFNDLQYGDEVASVTTYNVLSGSIPEGQLFKPNITFKDYPSSYAIPGVYLSKDLVLGATVLDKNSKDVSENYEFNFSSPGIVVVQRQIRIEPTKTEYPSNGVAIQLKNNFALTEGSILEGHQISCSFSKTIVYAGKHKTNITAKITDQNGKDITEYYSYNSDDEFTINIVGEIININLSANNILQKEFDGDSFVDVITSIIEEQYRKIDSDPENSISEIIFSDRIKNYIYYDPVNIYLDITDDDIGVIHETYSFVISPCRLEIKKRTLKIYAPDIEIEYSTSLRFNDKFNLYEEYAKIENVNSKYSYIGLLEEKGHSVQFGDNKKELKNEYFYFERYGNSLINVGSYDYNIFSEYISVYAKDEDGNNIDISPSYDIQYVGKIKVTPLQIYLINIDGNDSIIETYTGKEIDLNDLKWAYRTFDKTTNDYVSKYDLLITNVIFKNFGDVKIIDCDDYVLYPCGATIYASYTDENEKSHYIDVSSNYIFEHKSIDLTIKPYRIEFVFEEKEFIVKSEKTKSVSIFDFIKSNITLACPNHKFEIESSFTKIDCSSYKKGSYSITDLFKLESNTKIIKVTDSNDLDNNVTSNYQLVYKNIIEKIVKFSNKVISLNLPTITQKKGCDSNTILSDICATLLSKINNQLKLEGINVTVEGYLDDSEIRNNDAGVYTYYLVTTATDVDFTNNVGVFIVTE